MIKIVVFFDKVMIGSLLRICFLHVMIINCCHTLASFLDSINDYLEAMAQQLYDYWFVQFDFPDENGKPYKSSGGKMARNNKLKKEIPEGWTVLPLSQTSKIVNGATPSKESPYNYGGNIVWVTPKDLSIQKSKFTYFGERNISQQGYDSCSTTLVGVNAILLSSRAPIGLLSIAKCELCTNQGFKSIDPYDKDNTPYLYYYIKEHLPQIEQLGSGTTFKEVSRGDIEGFPVMIPQGKILTSWNMLIKELFEKQYQLYTEVVHFSRMQDELLPMLLNGQVSIKPLNNHFVEWDRMLSSAFSKSRMYERRINPKNCGRNGWFPTRRSNAAAARSGTGSA